MAEAVKRLPEVPRDVFINQFICLSKSILQNGLPATGTEPELMQAASALIYNKMVHINGACHAKG